MGTLIGEFQKYTNYVNTVRCDVWCVFAKRILRLFSESNENGMHRHAFVILNWYGHWANPTQNETIPNIPSLVESKCTSVPFTLTITSPASTYEEKANDSIRSRTRNRIDYSLKIRMHLVVFMIRNTKTRRQRRMYRARELYHRSFVYGFQLRTRLRMRWYQRAVVSFSTRSRRAQPTKCHDVIIKFVAQIIHYYQLIEFARKIQRCTRSLFYCYK